MKTSMMTMPLTVGSLADHAGRYHAATEIASVETTGGIEPTTWGAVAANSRALANADPPPLKWSAPIVRKRRIKDGNQTSQAGRDCHQVTAS